MGPRHARLLQAERRRLALEDPFIALELLEETFDAGMDRMHAAWEQFGRDFDAMRKRAAAAGRAEAERQHGWPRSAH
jgi:hypothetical protein